MSDVLNGLPSLMPIQAFLTDFADRSGLLDRHGWGPELQEILVTEFTKLLDNDLITVEKDPARKAIITNKGTHLVGEYRVAKSPKPLRHGSRNERSFPAVLVQEMEFLTNTPWLINQRLLAMTEDAEKTAPDIAEQVMSDDPNFVTSAKKYGRDVSYIPVFADRVTRLYGEGQFSYTGNKARRAHLDTPATDYGWWEEFFPICSLLEINPEESEEIVKDWANFIRKGGTWDEVRKHLWVLEVLTTGRSGAMASVDIRTSGPLLGSIIASCLSLMQDTNIFGPDGRDCRLTVARRIIIPTALNPWGAFIKSKDAAKPIITALFYGQAATGGADHMMWSDPKKTPLNWKSIYGIVNNDVVLKNRPKLNPDYRPMVDDLGPNAAYAAFKELSTSWNSTFWASYPEVLDLRQRLSDAYDYAKDNGREATITAPHGVVYTHKKWELDMDAPRWRFRCQHPKLVEAGWTHGLDITLAGMKDVASGHSLFVRIVHLFDAWFRHRVNRHVRRTMIRLRGYAVGCGSIHDAFLVPLWMMPYMLGIIRAVLHEAVEVLPPIVNEFLRRNGQEPMPELSPEQKAKVHRSIAKNKAFLSFN